MRTDLTQRFTAALMLAAVLMQVVLAPMAFATVGDDWTPRPLVPPVSELPKAQPAATQPAASAPSPAKQNEAELALLNERLKPAEPFLASVEAKLNLKAKPNQPLLERLNTIQTVLYGHQQFQDAGALLTELATLFPAEASKLPVNQAPTATVASFPAAPSNQAPQVITPQPQHAQRLTAPSSIATSPYSQMASMAAQPPQQSKKSFWQKSNEDDPFSDPFFQDEDTLSGSVHQVQPKASKLAGVGQGIAGLAMLAGVVAGGYFLNKNTPNNYVAPAHGYIPPGGVVPYGYAQGYVPYGTQSYGYPTLIPQNTRGYLLPNPGYSVTPYTSPSMYGLPLNSRLPGAYYGMPVQRVMPRGSQVGMFAY